jgi:amino acid permease
LPCKDTVEELFWRKDSLSIIQNNEQEVNKGPTFRMSPKANFFITFICVLIPYLLSLFLSSLGDALTVVGSTTNPITGFIIPILFYWKIYPDKSIFSREKLPSLLTGIVIVAISIIDLLHFFLFKKG